MRIVARCERPLRLALIAACLVLLAGCFATSQTKPMLDPLPPELAAPPRKAIPLERIEQELDLERRMKESDPSRVERSPSGLSVTTTKS